MECHFPSPLRVSPSVCIAPLTSTLTVCGANRMSVSGLLVHSLTSDRHWAQLSRNFLTVRLSVSAPRQNKDTFGSIRPLEWGWRAKCPFSSTVLLCAKNTCKRATGYGKQWCPLPATTLSALIDMAPSPLRTARSLCSFIHRHCPAGTLSRLFLSVLLLRLLLFRKQTDRFLLKSTLTVLRAFRIATRTEDFKNGNNFHWSLCCHLMYFWSIFLVFLDVWKSGGLMSFR